jgi:CrcB protein
MVSADFRASTWLWIAAGGALGSLLRFLASTAWLTWGSNGYPWPTLLVNVAGSALIGFLAAVSSSQGRWPLKLEHQAFLMAGFCGGLTTFSFVSLELGLMVHQQAWGDAAGYLILSLLGWLGAVWIGYQAGVGLSANRARKAKG